MTYTLHLGDCVEVMRSMEPNSIDAIVTDPPYRLVSIVKRYGKSGPSDANLKLKVGQGNSPHERTARGFMGKIWDGEDTAHDPATWAEVLRVAKPGAHLLAFGGTRTFHRLACAIEDAGWEIRDCIMWVYGSGFPKSHNLKGDYEGWGTALKPAWEPILVCRKPIECTVADNMLEYDTGAINIDASRVEGIVPEVHATRQTDYPQSHKAGQGPGWGRSRAGYAGDEVDFVPSSKGRWPANLIHDGSEEVLELFPQSSPAGTQAKRKTSNGLFGLGHDGKTNIWHNDSGSAARFFYCAKASKQDRDEGCEEMPLIEIKGDVSLRQKGVHGQTGKPNKPLFSRNVHPTVKPTALMRYLCKLVTYPNGVILDPFMGSGSTGKAAVLDGFNFVGIDNEKQYVEIAEARIKYAMKQSEVE